MCEPSALARHLKRVAKDGGFSLQYFYELEDAKTRRDALRKFQYGPKEHALNPFLESEPNRTELGEWLQAHDALTAEIYQWKAQPVRLPWGVDSVNLTQQSQIFGSLRSNPTKAGIGGPVVLAAAAIDKSLRDALIAEAEDAKNQAARRAEALRK